MVGRAAMFRRRIINIIPGRLKKKNKPDCQHLITKRGTGSCPIPWNYSFPTHAARTPRTPVVRARARALSLSRKVTRNVYVYIFVLYDTR